MFGMTPFRPPTNPIASSTSHSETWVIDNVHSKTGTFIYHANPGGVPFVFTADLRPPSIRISTLKPYTPISAVFRFEFSSPTRKLSRETFATFSGDHLSETTSLWDSLSQMEKHGLIDRGMLRIDIRIQVSPPARVAHVGLENFGVTCYVNSVLQALFHIRDFRSLVYKLDPRDPLLLELQRLFARLQLSDGPCPSRNLVEALGWTHEDDFRRHDARGLISHLLESVFNAVRSTPLERDYVRLFQGTRGVADSSEIFSNVSLNISATSTLDQAIGRFLGSGAVEFVELPNVLFLHMRGNAGHFEYPRELDGFSLFGVFVRSIVFLRIGGQWLRFDDSVVTRVDDADADVFGGSPVIADRYWGRSNGCELPYLLVYTHGLTMEDVSEREIPAAAVTYLAQVNRSSRVRRLADMYVEVTISLVTDDTLENHAANRIVRISPDATSPSVSLMRGSSCSVLYERVGELLELDDIALFSVQDATLRLVPNSEKLLIEMGIGNCIYVFPESISDDTVVFLWSFCFRARTQVMYLGSVKVCVGESIGQVCKLLGCDLADSTRIWQMKGANDIVPIRAWDSRLRTCCHIIAELAELRDNDEEEEEEDGFAVVSFMRRQKQLAFPEFVKYACQEWRCVLHYGRESQTVVFPRYIELTTLCEFFAGVFAVKSATFALFAECGPAVVEWFEDWDDPPRDIWFYSFPDASRHFVACAVHVVFDMSRDAKVSYQTVGALFSYHARVSDLKEYAIEANYFAGDATIRVVELDKLGITKILDDLGALRGLGQKTRIEEVPVSQKNVRKEKLLSVVWNYRNKETVTFLTVREPKDTSGRLKNRLRNVLIGVRPAYSQQLRTATFIIQSISDGAPMKMEEVTPLQTVDVAVYRLVVRSAHGQ
jgi:hypothetical protein